MCTIEDPTSSVVVPRLTAAGADLSRVHFLVPTDPDLGLFVTLPRDYAEAERLIREHDARMFVLDPFVAVLDDRR